MRILGIDPGYAHIGYGLLRQEKSIITVEKCGLKESSSKLSFFERLGVIQENMNQILEETNPDYVVMEEMFTFKTTIATKNILQARGVICITILNKGLSIYEVNPTTVKKHVAGSGKAKKPDMRKAIENSLDLSKFKSRQDDMLDALSIGYFFISSPV